MNALFACSIQEKRAMTAASQGTTRAYKSIMPNQTQTCQETNKYYRQTQQALLQLPTPGQLQRAASTFQQPEHSYSCSQSQLACYQTSHRQSLNSRSLHRSQQLPLLLSHSRPQLLRMRLQQFKSLQSPATPSRLPWGASIGRHAACGGRGSAALSYGRSR